jgi:hypothetical protein
VHLVPFATSAERVTIPLDVVTVAGVALKLEICGVLAPAGVACCTTQPNTSVANATNMLRAERW